ncbi:MAG: DUF6240 domain-containing protein [Lachnospiraceae bacterium]|nr:DUF6240 domain-containing protein [Lachnospiraceae bacterium]
MNGQMINNMIQKYNSAEGSYRTDGQGSAADFFNPETAGTSKEPSKSYRLSIDNPGRTHPDVVKGINLVKNAGKIGEAGISQKKSAAENLKNSLAAGIPADVCKDRMVLLSNTMTEEGYKKAAEQGFSFAGMDPKEAVTVADEIRATLAKAGVVIKGFNDDLSVEKLQEITGSPAMAEAVKKSFDEVSLPVTEDNVTEVKDALEIARQLEVPSQDVKEYMVENGLRPTVENLYYAEHSVGTGAAQLQDKDPVITDGDDAIGSRIKEIINRAGEDVNETNITIASRMIEDGLAFNEESFLAMKELEDIKIPGSDEGFIKVAAQSVSDGLPAMQADLTDKGSLAEQAEDSLEVIEAAGEDPDIVSLVVDKGEILNVKNLRQSREEIKEGKAGISYHKDAEKSGDLITARRQVEETRLVMSLQVNMRLLKQGISIDTMELNDLVMRLKQAESEMLKDKFGTDNALLAARSEEIFRQSVMTVSDIPSMPVSVIAEFESVRTIDLELFSARGNERKNAFEAAGAAYETMQTEVRADLGDSLKKAFEHADSLLKELGIDPSEENLRAARILGYNRMEINDKNMSSVKDGYRMVSGIISKMTPAAVLGLIRDGANPLKLSMEELEERLERLSVSDTGEKYSEYLVRMQERGAITAEESESFVGIYRMIRQTESLDGAAVGRLIEQGREISFTNILSAIRSRRAGGMDISIDDLSDGMKGSISNDITEQIETAYAQARAESEAESIREAAHTSSTIYHELVESGVIATADHVRGLKDLRKNRGELFRNTADGKRFEGLKGDTAEDLLLSRVNEGYADVVERFDDEESAQTAYDGMLSSMKQLLDAAVWSDGDMIDVREYGSAMRQITVAGSLSRQESYEIPMEIGGEMTSVTVKILHESNISGAVDVDMETEIYGRLRARFEASEGSLLGMIASSTLQGRNAAEGMREELTDRLSDAGIPVSEINFVYSEKMTVNLSRPFADKNSKEFDTAVLYKTAKIFMQTMGGTQ